MGGCLKSQTLSSLIGGLSCLSDWQGETRCSWYWSSPNCAQLLTLTPCPCKQWLLAFIVVVFCLFFNAAKISSSSGCNVLKKPWHNIGDTLPSLLTGPNPTPQHPTRHLWRRCPSSRWAQPVTWRAAHRLSFCSDLQPPLGPIMQWTTCRKVRVMGKMTQLGISPQGSSLWFHTFGSWVTWENI